MVSKRTENLLKVDAERVIHPLTVVGWNAGVVIEGGRGLMVQDTEGKEYIDCCSQLGYCTLGHGNKEIIDAVVKQMNKLEASHLFWGMSNAVDIECSQELAKVVPEGLGHFQLTCSGTEATDASIKAARLFWRLQGKDKFKIISLFASYHGFGMATWASAFGRGSVWSGVGPPAPGFIHIPPYYCYRCMFGLKYPDCNIQCARYLAQVIENEGVDSVAAFMAEPVQGASGYVWPPPEYWPMVRKICDDYNILLIADEVHSGFTRSGKLFALQHWDVTPDMIAMAKGITSGYIAFGGLAINDRIYQVLKGHPFPTGPTYSGHPVGCAAAMATLNIYNRDKVADNSRQVAKHMMERLKAEFVPLPCVGSLSEAKGLMLGLEIVADKATKTPPDPAIGKQWHKQILEKGLFTRPFLGNYANRIMIAPPCIITVAEADRILDILLPTVAAIKPS